MPHNPAHGGQAPDPTGGLGALASWGQVLQQLVSNFTNAGNRVRIGGMLGPNPGLTRRPAPSPGSVAQAPAWLQNMLTPTTVQRQPSQLASRWVPPAGWQPRSLPQRDVPRIGQGGPAKVY